MSNLSPGRAGKPTKISDRGRALAQGLFEQRYDDIDAHLDPDPVKIRAWIQANADEILVKDPRMLNPVFVLRRSMMRYAAMPTALEVHYDNRAWGKVPDVSKLQVEDRRPHEGKSREELLEHLAALRQKIEEGEE